MVGSDVLEWQILGGAGSPRLFGDYRPSAVVGTGAAPWLSPPLDSKTGIKFKDHTAFTTKTPESKQERERIYPQMMSLLQAAQVHNK